MRDPQTRNPYWKYEIREAKVGKFTFKEMWKWCKWNVKKYKKTIEKSIKELFRKVKRIVLIT